MERVVRRKKMNSQRVNDHKNGGDDTDALTTQVLRLGSIEDKRKWMKTESQMMDHQFNIKSDLQQKRRNTSLMMKTCRTKETGQKTLLKALL